MENQKFYQRNWFIWLMLLVVSPIGIILLWSNKNYSKKMKSILSIVFGMIFVLIATPDKSVDQKKTANTTKVQVSKSVQNESKNYVAPNEKVITPKNYTGYRQIEVDGGNLSGHREANVVVDIGYGDREYYAFTNEYGQLIRVTAKVITLQDASKEKVLSSGRYYKDEAKVPGVESTNLDEGHIIADSLGGVSNAYNITPQNSTLNRHGNQAYMEKVIRDAGGCTDFEALITYPNTSTQIPRHYEYTYKLKGKVIKDSFDNVNPDKVNKKLVRD